MSCREPITNRPQGQLLLDYLTDAVISTKAAFTGTPNISPDSRHIAIVDNAQKQHSIQDNGVTIIVQKITRMHIILFNELRGIIRKKILTVLSVSPTNNYSK